MTFQYNQVSSWLVPSRTPVPLASRDMKTTGDESEFPESFTLPAEHCGAWNLVVQHYFQPIKSVTQICDKISWSATLSFPLSVARHEITWPGLVSNVLFSVVKHLKSDRGLRTQNTCKIFTGAKRLFTKRLFHFHWNFNCLMTRNM